MENKIVNKWFKVLCVAETGDTGYFEGFTPQHAAEAAEEEFGCWVQYAEIVNTGVRVVDLESGKIRIKWDD